MANKKNIIYVALLLGFLLFDVPAVFATNCYNAANFTGYTGYNGTYTDQSSPFNSQPTYTNGTRFLWYDNNREVLTPAVNDESSYFGHNITGTDPVGSDGTYFKNGNSLGTNDGQVATTTCGGGGGGGGSASSSTSTAALLFQQIASSTGNIIQSSFDFLYWFIAFLLAIMGVSLIAGGVIWGVREAMKTRS